MQRVKLNQLSQNVLKLPRLPIPSIDDTFARYKASLDPLKKKEKVDKHLEKLEAFRNTTADALQAELVEQDRLAASSGEYPHSYIEPLWDEMYLGYRGPSPINMSPCFSSKPIGKNLTQCEVASRVMATVVKFIRKLTEEGIDVSTKTPSDVSQMAKQFAVSRIPQKGRDTFFAAPLAKANTFTILRDGNIYILRITDDQGRLYPTSTICAALSHINKITPADNTAPVSVLTSWERDDWLAAKDKLCELPENREMFEAIDQSIAVICLDNVPWGSDRSKKVAAMLHGSAEEVENRWYDKHQIIISSDAQLSFNFEHSFSDGIMWSRWINEVFADITGMKSPYATLPAVVEAPSTEDTSSIIRPLNFKFGKSQANKIRNARTAITKLADTVKLVPYELSFGKKVIKGMDLSPDAFMQIAFQMAYFQSHGKIAPTYESCSTNSFFHGRTETIRTASAEMGQFVRAAADGVVKKDLIQAAAKKHVQLAREAQAGQGVDRHLLALSEIAKRKQDQAALDFFNDKLFNYSKTWLMSTSNLSQPFIEYFAFGPVAADGYGIGYSIDTDSVRMCVSNFQESESTCSTTFINNLVDSAALLQKTFSR